MPAEQAGFMGQQPGYMIMIDYAGLRLHDSCAGLWSYWPCVGALVVGSIRRARWPWSRKADILYGRRHYSLEGEGIRGCGAKLSGTTNASAASASERLVYARALVIVE